jgi:hypothetical protein
MLSLKFVFAQHCDACLYSQHLRLRQEDDQFEARLEYIVTAFLQKKKTQKLVGHFYRSFVSNIHSVPQ